jgi:hypothetical protein
MTMSFENWRPETVLALIVGLGIYFSAVSAVYIGFGPPAKRKAMLKKKQEEALKMNKEDRDPVPTPKDEDSVKEILDSLKKEKDRSLGNIKSLEEDIRRHEDRLRKMEEEKKSGE